MPKDAKANPTAFKNAQAVIASTLKTLKLPDSWLKPTLELVARESSFNVNAKNPDSTAHGLFQFLDATRKNYGWKGVDWSNPQHQALAGLKYVKDRYGTPEDALKHWDDKKWY